MATDEAIVAELRAALKTADMETTTGVTLAAPFPLSARRPSPVASRGLTTDASGTLRLCTVCAERQLRKQVEAELGVDLTDRKAVIRAEVQRPLHAKV